MRLNELFHELLMGTPIKRKVWDGFWKYESSSKSIIIYTKEGLELNLLRTEDVIHTIANVIAEDWEIAESSNCKMLDMDKDSDIHGGKLNHDSKKRK